MGAGRGRIQGMNEAGDIVEFAIGEIERGHPRVRLSVADDAADLGEAATAQTPIVGERRSLVAAIRISSVTALAMLAIACLARRLRGESRDQQTERGSMDQAHAVHRTANAIVLAGPVVSRNDMNAAVLLPAVLRV